MDLNTINEELSKIELCDNVDVVEHRAQALLVKELNEMTVEERNKVFHDVHGVADSIEETEELINSKLEKLEHEISLLLSSSSSSFNEAYLTAKQASVEYVSNTKFRLKFLRGFNFDVKAAAYAIIHFFHEKQNIFGTDKLVKDICLSEDMNEQDKACIMSGYCQILPCRDQSGRPILFFNARLRQGHSLMSVLRTVYYFFMTVSEDEQNQLSGIVLISMDIGKDKKFDRALALQGGRLGQVVPIRIAAYHICCDTPFIKLMSIVILFVTGKTYRHRLRTHCGTYKECILELQSFGIPRVILPIDLDGTYDLSRVTEWCEMRTAIESSRAITTSSSPPPEEEEEKLSPLSTKTNILKSSFLENTMNHTESNINQSEESLMIFDDTQQYNNDDMTALTAISVDSSKQEPKETGRNNTSNKKSNEDVGDNYNNNDNDDNAVVVTIPGYYDVLFGRGKGLIKHPGNLRFHQILDMYETKYESSRKKEKGVVIGEILQAVWNCNGRFLKQQSHKKQQTAKQKNKTKSKSHYSGLWVEVSVPEAHDKVSQGFRTRRASVLAGVDLGAQREAAMARLDMENISLLEPIRVTTTETKTSEDGSERAKRIKQ